MSALNPVPSDTIPPCNICGGQSFGRGPGGRLSATGLPPRCERCQSLERHRTLRAVHDQLRRVLPYHEMSCLQLSVDRAIETSWFASRLVSEYDVSHSLDIQDLGLPSRAFDVVICNHVLEHVAEDRQALSEMLRVTTDRGFLQLAFPDPARNARTRDWGYPNWDDHGHYRIYGMDVCDKLRAAAEDVFFVQFPTEDPTTGMEDIYFFLTRAPAAVEALKAINDRIIVEGGAGQAPATPARPADLAQERLVRDPVGYHRRALMGETDDGPGQTPAASRLDPILMSETQRRFGTGGHVCFLGTPSTGDFMTLNLARRLGEASVLCHDPAIDPAPDALRSLVDAYLSPDPDVTEAEGACATLTPESLRELMGGAARVAICGSATESDRILVRLKLAEEILKPSGFVILDGFLDLDHPATAAAIAAYLAEDATGDRLRPIALSDGRLYLSKRAAAAAYLAELRNMADAGAASVTGMRVLGAEVLAFASVTAAFTAKPVVKSFAVQLIASNEGVGDARARAYPLRLEGVEPNEKVSLELTIDHLSSPVEITAAGVARTVAAQGAPALEVMEVDLRALGASRRVEVQIAPQSHSGTIGGARLTAVRLS